MLYKALIYELFVFWRPWERYSLRGHSVFAAEAPDKIREVVEPAQGGDGTDRVRALPEQIGRVTEPVIRQVFAESESRLAAEDPHEVSVAVVNRLAASLTVIGSEK